MGSAFAMKGEVTGYGVAALLYTADGRYLMQLRDDRPGVSMRGYWGLFGGWIESGERPGIALARELQEELAYPIEAPESAFTEIKYSLEFASYGIHQKYFFAVPIEESQIDGFRLGEGQDMALHSPEALVLLPNVIPWDLCGVLMHAKRNHICDAIYRRTEAL